MQKTHAKLMAKSHIYASWHRHSRHGFYHFVLVAIFGMFVATGLLLQAADPALSNEQPVLRAGQKTVKAQQDLHQLTTELLGAVKNYHGAGESGKSLAAQVLVERAKLRREKMLAAAQSDPAGFLSAALPDDLIAKLPSEIQPFMEHDEQISGELENIYEEYFTEGRARQRIYVTDKNSGKKYELNFASGRLDLNSGSVVKAKGRVLSDQMVLEQAGGAAVQTVSVAAASVSGDQKAIVILMNFADNSSQPWTPAQVYDAVFGGANSANRYYQDTSNGSVSFSGNVVGWYTLPNSSATCDNYNWASAADAAATQAGVVLSNYSRRVYVFPRVYACSWAGLGTVGGSPSKAWISGYGNDPRIYQHELGHNLTSRHASSLACGSKQIDASANCTFSEYGDNYDTMGYWNSFQWNAPQKTATGWVGSANVKAVTSNGTYSLGYLESSGGALPQALKILKPDTGEYYYFGYRQPKGFDAGLPAGIIRGAQIFLWDGSMQTKLLDATPGNGFADASLMDGMSFSDPTNGITVTQVSHDASQVILNVVFAGVQCAPKAPLVTISPSSQTAGSGSSLKYSVIVSNVDSSACVPASFSLTGSLPAGFAGSFSSSTLTLSPGSQGVVYYTVTSPVGQADGSYPFSVSTADASEPAHTALASATFLVYTDTGAPSVSITSPADGSVIGNTVSVAVSASDSAGVAKVEIYVDGALKTTLASVPYTYRLNSRKLARGAHVIKAIAYDKSGNSASAAITVYK